jgi:hypothetical protein
MKKFSFSIIASIVSLVVFSFVLSSVADAAVRVRGYYRKDGTYVQPYYRSNPDGNPFNNWSFPGNTNPYTGKTATGDPNTYLKNYYNTYSSVNPYSIYNYQLPTPTPQPTVKAPANAYVYGSWWFCNSGYEKVGNSCEKIIAPANSTIYYGLWFCNSGYKQVGNSCEKIIVPANAYVMGSLWFCNYGYNEVNGACEKIIVPVNAIAVGGTWQCNSGYKQVGNSCENISQNK